MSIPKRLTITNASCRSLNHTLLLLFPHRPEAANEFYDGDHDNDKESDVEI